MPQLFKGEKEIRKEFTKLDVDNSGFITKGKRSRECWGFYLYSEFRWDDDCHHWLWPFRGRQGWCYSLSFYSASISWFDPKLTYLSSEPQSQTSDWLPFLLIYTMKPSYLHFWGQFLIKVSILQWKLLVFPPIRKSIFYVRI